MPSPFLVVIPATLTEDQFTALAKVGFQREGRVDVDGSDADTFVSGPAKDEHAAREHVSDALGRKPGMKAWDLKASPFTLDPEIDGESE